MAKGDRPKLPDFVLAENDRIADEIGSRYKAALRRAFGLPDRPEEKAGRDEEGGDG